MPYRFRKNESAAKATARIAAEEIETALAELADPQLSMERRIHQARRRCKRIRALLRLTKGALPGDFRTENLWFRDAARLLSGNRDATSVLAAFDGIAASAEPEAFASVARGLRRQRDELEQATDVDGLLSAYLIRMHKAAERIPHWRFRAKGFAVVRHGLRCTYKKCRDALGKAHDDEDPPVELFHEWRKQVKYHWFHVKLLEGSWSAVLGEHAVAARDLSEVLGDEHDLSVLLERVGGTPEQFGSAATVDRFIAAARERRSALRRQAMPSARRLFAEQPKQFTRRIESYWRAWRTAS